jgi:hypothetical protein
LVLLPENVEKAAKGTIAYVLPSGAKQGPKSWYQIRLHARVTFGQGTGNAYVFASHNGYVSALIEYDMQKSGSSRRIIRRTVSYIDGSQRGLVRGVESEFRFRNYLQYKSVQPGLNHLMFSVEVSDSLKLDR